MARDDDTNVQGAQ